MQPSTPLTNQLPPGIAAPVLLMLPGMVCGPASWQQQAEALAGNVQIVIADYDSADNITVMARQLLAFFDAPLLLAGHSMGARVALEIYRLAPHRVLGLCLIATESRARPEGERGQAEDSTRMGLLKLAVDQGMQAMANAWIPALLGPRSQNDRRVQDALRAMISAHSVETLAHHIEAGRTRPDAHALLSSITCPTLLIAGEQDVLRPPALLEEMHLAITHSRFLVIEGCGHMPTMEAPESINLAMQTWLTQSLSR
ncbi:alpha/beta hydrolase [Pseudomonas sp. B21-056]|jgi:pimeloyl-ACP methyl ester carboxylesterase|uniref:alpha/beta fold hydrolase n=1 Tax=Pseudomonas sp. B21-056 TaxID=2895495 RepID=UPI002230FBAD|nr:alpha/beta hydrolase [Pseudomonas sp. B21-056]UZE25901.1 alpha/beta hydrolase [Pseudomonas sp. B21-056]